MTWREDFDAAVLAFLNRERPTAKAIVRVGGYGTDWDGDTEGGFYSSFRAEVRYVDTEGRVRETDFSGESMAELWDFVIKGGGS